MRAGEASPARRSVFAGRAPSSGPLPRPRGTSLWAGSAPDLLASRRSGAATTGPADIHIEDRACEADLVPLGRAGLRVRPRWRVAPGWSLAVLASAVLAGVVTAMVQVPGATPGDLAGLWSAGDAPSGSGATRSAPAASPVNLASVEAGAAVPAPTAVPPPDGRMAGGPETTASLLGVALGRDGAPGRFVRSAGSNAGDGGPSRSARLDPTGRAGVPWRPILPRVGGAPQALTRLVAFESAPFPYAGAVPKSGSPFLDAGADGRKGHRSWRGRVFWENETFNDRRVLMHVPAGFDPERPGVIVVFFHGHGATLKRDVLERQQVAAQISAAGANAVLLAPQFAVDASDSSVGKFWEPGGFKRFLDESAQQLAQMSGDGAAAQTFARMPVVIVGYSGGFAPAAWSLHVGGARNRVRGVVMLDAMYGEFEKFAGWIEATRGAFFVNASTHFTRGGAGALEQMLGARGVASTGELPATLSRGGVVFLNVEASHRDYVNTAWTDGPIRDILRRLPEYRLGDGEAAAVASLEPRPPARSRSAAVAGP